MPTETPQAVAAKPPPGVTPRYIWLEQRRCELARAIGEYTRTGHNPARVREWARELAEMELPESPAPQNYAFLAGEVAVFDGGVCGLSNCSCKLRFNRTGST